MSETLLRLMNLPPSQFSGVCRDADGNYLASVHGDLGYNHFLGKPAQPHAGAGRDLMLKVWNGLTPEQQRIICFEAEHPVDGEPILLHSDFGVPLPYTDFNREQTI